MLSPHVTFRRVQLDAGACGPDAADAGGNLIRDADEGSGRMQGRVLDADTLCMVTHWDNNEGMHGVCLSLLELECLLPTRLPPKLWTQVLAVVCRRRGAQVSILPLCGTTR